MKLFNKFFNENAQEQEFFAEEEPFSKEIAEKSYSFRNWYCEKNKVNYVFASKNRKSVIIKLDNCTLESATTFVYIDSKDGKFGVLK